MAGMEPPLGGGCSEAAAGAAAASAASGATGGDTSDRVRRALMQAHQDERLPRAFSRAEEEADSASGPRAAAGAGGAAASAPSVGGVQGQSSGPKLGRLVGGPSKRDRREVEHESRKAKRLRRAPALVVFGLGNIGEECAGQRHNIGQQVVEALHAGEEFSLVEAHSDAARVFRRTGPDRQWLAVPPQGHINSSGPALKAALQALQQEAAQFLVVADDVTLPLGVLRMKAKGSSGGHNGLRSLEKEFGQDYHRLKLGIGGGRSKDHVIGPFAPEEQQLVRAVVQRAKEAVDVWLQMGPEEIEQVLSKVNRPEFCKVPDLAEVSGKAAVG